MRCALSGRETLLEEDLSEEQVEAELAPLAAQLAYTTARLGNTSDALAAYEVCFHLALQWHAVLEQQSTGDVLSGFRQADGAIQGAVLLLCSPPHVKGHPKAPALQVSPTCILVCPRLC